MTKVLLKFNNWINFGRFLKSVGFYDPEKAMIQ